jgi:hypothetical protein
LKTETSYGKNLGGEGDLVREKCLLRACDAECESIYASGHLRLNTPEGGSRTDPSPWEDRGRLKEKSPGRKTPGGNRRTRRLINGA